MDNVIPIRDEPIDISPASDTSAGPLKTTGGGGTSDGMNRNDFHGRIARLEGASTALLGAVGIVSAVLIGGLALLWSDVSRLEGKVDALPDAIRSELQSLNSTMMEAIAAGRESASPPSPVVVIRDAAPTVPQSTPEAPAPETPIE